FIGFSIEASGKETFQSSNPATGIKLENLFYKATAEEVDKTANMAAAAFQVYRKKSGVEKATFLEAIATEIKALGDDLIQMCVTESALPKGRIEGERERTMNQLRLFASLLREGSWLDARIETAIPDRTPLPKADLRYMQIGLGP